MKRLLVPILVALLGTALFTGLLYVGFYRSLDSRFYDLLLRIKPAIEEDESILLLEVDDPTISTIDMYPLGRDIFADGLILLKEFGPAWTMLDVEFVDRSPAGINLDYLDNVLPASVQGTFEYIMSSNRELVDGILNGRIDRKTAIDYLTQLESMSINESSNLYEQIRGVAFDKDEYLGKAIGYLDDVTVTVNMTDEVDDSPDVDARGFVIDNRTIKIDLELEGSPWDPENLLSEPSSRTRKPVAVDILPSIMQVTEKAAWSGFPRMFIDSDGVRRRIDVVFSYDGAFYSHMGFGTWWLRQGSPPLEVRKNKLYAGDLAIPLDRDGKMLINWPKRMFDGTPLGRKAAAAYDPTTAEHRLSFLTLYNHDLMWRDLKAYIGEMEYYGIFSDIYGKTLQPLSILQTNIDAELTSLLDTGNGAGAADLAGKRDEFLDTAYSFFTEEARGYVLADLEFAMSNPVLLPEQVEEFSYILERVPVLFDDAAEITSDLRNVREELERRIAGTTLVVGYTGTSTTDYGANPFQEKYMNMGIYGAVYNSLVQQDFLAESPMWLTILVTLLSGVIIAVVSLIAIDKTRLNTILGLVFLVLLIAGTGAVFVFTGFYLNMLPILLVLITTYIASQLGNFLTASRERSFIENAFGQTISPVIVNQILEDPSRMNMYGERRIITSMFTDIEKFSTLTEKLTKSGEGSKLFEILKRYLTPLSDIILDENGTIDKFEGDAIIAFWNAPLDQEDHAERACSAALRMVKAENDINLQLIEEGILTQEIVDMLPKKRLFTRIGLHTGPNDVGFIGTDRRKSYTALGDNMNLAARLEGVNKKYNTQVLMSDVTEQIIHTQFITRQLDKVRVEGKEDIITLYELTCFKEDFSETQRECFNHYREGLKFFRAQEWDESEELFRIIAEKLPGDGPSNVFLDRIKEYRKKRLRKDWDGVYRMEFK